jgi:hypothetical protein
MFSALPARGRSLAGIGNTPIHVQQVIDGTVELLPDWADEEAAYTAQGLTHAGA